MKTVIPSSPKIQIQTGSNAQSTTAPPNRRPDVGRRGPDPLEYQHRHRSLRDYAQLLALRYDQGRTRHAYYRQLRLLADHFDRDPATLTEDRLRAYFLWLGQEKQFGGSAMKLARCALRCFFRECLRIEGWTVFEEVRCAPPQTLPLVLAREQVAALLGAVREPRYRTVLSLIYHTGLRVGEAVRIPIERLARVKQRAN